MARSMFLPLATRHSPLSVVGSHLVASLAAGRPDPASWLRVHCASAERSTLRPAGAVTSFYLATVRPADTEAMEVARAAADGGACRLSGLHSSPSGPGC